EGELLSASAVPGLCAHCSRRRNARARLSFRDGGAARTEHSAGVLAGEADDGCARGGCGGRICFAVSGAYASTGLDRSSSGFDGDGIRAHRRTVIRAAGGRAAWGGHFRTLRSLFAGAVE